MFKKSSFASSLFSGVEYLTFPLDKLLILLLFFLVPVILQQPDFGDIISPVAKDESPLDVVELPDEDLQSPHGNLTPASPDQATQAVLK